MEKKSQGKTSKKVDSTQPEVCCPYFDAEKKACSHPDCCRMLRFECKYSNRHYKK